MSVRSSRKEICNRAVHQIRPQMFQNDRRAMTGSCRGTFSHGPRSTATFIRMDFISLVALNCRITWVSEAFGLHPGLVNNSGGRSVKITTASASSRGRTSLNKTQHGYFFFSTVHCVCVCDKLCLTLTFRKAAKAGPKLVCVLVRSLIHAGSLPSVVGRE